MNTFEGAHLIFFLSVTIAKYFAHFCSSERLVDDQISIAIDTKEHLIGQRNSMKRMQARVNDLSTRFPAVNNLMQRISLRKKRDAIILGSVIGIGFILLLLYATR